jgi:catalase
VPNANAPFFGIHTFKFIGKDDNVTLVKWRFEPEDGEKSLTDDQLKTMQANFVEPARSSPVRLRRSGRAASPLKESAQCQ